MADKAFACVGCMLLIVGIWGPIALTGGTYESLYDLVQDGDGHATLVLLCASVAAALILTYLGRTRWLLAPAGILIVALFLEAQRIRGRALDMLHWRPGGAESVAPYYPLVPLGWILFSAGITCLIAGAWYHRSRS